MLQLCNNAWARNGHLGQLFVNVFYLLISVYRSFLKSDQYKILDRMEYKKILHF